MGAGVPNAARVWTETQHTHTHTHKGHAGTGVWMNPIIPSSHPIIPSFHDIFSSSHHIITSSHNPIIPSSHHHISSSHHPMMTPSRPGSPTHHALANTTPQITRPAHIRNTHTTTTRPDRVLCEGEETGVQHGRDLLDTGKYTPSRTRRWPSLASVVPRAVVVRGDGGSAALVFVVCFSKLVCCFG